MSGFVLSPYAVACVLAAFATAATLSAVRRRDPTPGTRLFSAILLAGTFWSLTEAAILRTICAVDRAYRVRR